MSEATKSVPRHVAIILDGNGRWAKMRMMPRSYGHSQGSKNVEQICEDAWKMGIKYLTVYAFSTENWKRPQEEVDTLMKLLRNYMKDCIKTSRKNDMRVRIIGDRSKLDADIRESIRELEEDSKNNQGLNFQVALNYGGRDEIVRAVRALTEECVQGKLKPEEITEDALRARLDTADIPDPDLLIRPGGEFRLSNFLLWQTAYTEFYWTDVLWPDFTKEDLEKAVDYFNSRERRFGGVNVDNKAPEKR